ncbi:MAG: hypothetical protein KC561_15100, partial [Myxococcales bacterium]|nr:hypothetical protein [Myxococcales bacterium]
MQFSKGTLKYDEDEGRYRITVRFYDVKTLESVFTSVKRDGVFSLSVESQAPSTQNVYVLFRTSRRGELFPATILAWNKGLVALKPDLEVRALQDLTDSLLDALADEGESDAPTQASSELYSPPGEGDDPGYSEAVRTQPKEKPQPSKPIPTPVKHPTPPPQRPAVRAPVAPTMDFDSLPLPETDSAEEDLKTSSLESLEVPQPQLGESERPLPDLPGVEASSLEADEGDLAAVSLEELIFDSDDETAAAVEDGPEPSADSNLAPDALDGPQARPVAFSPPKNGGTKLGESGAPKELKPRQRPKPKSGRPMGTGQTQDWPSGPPRQWKAQPERSATSNSETQPVAIDAKVLAELNEAPGEDHVKATVEVAPAEIGNAAAAAELRGAYEFLKSLELDDSLQIEDHAETGREALEHLPQAASWNPGAALIVSPMDGDREWYILSIGGKVVNGFRFPPTPQTSVTLYLLQKGEIDRGQADRILQTAHELRISEEVAISKLHLVERGPLRAAVATKVKWIVSEL